MIETTWSSISALIGLGLFVGLWVGVVIGRCRPTEPDRVYAEWKLQRFIKLEREVVFNTVRLYSEDLALEIDRILFENRP